MRLTFYFAEHSLFLEFYIYLSDYTANQNRVEIAELDSAMNVCDRYATLSLCLPDRMQRENEIFVKAYSENIPVIEEIRKQNYFGLFENTGETFSIGNFSSAIVEVWKLTPLALKHAKRRVSS